MLFGPGSAAGTLEGVSAEHKFLPGSYMTDVVIKPAQS